MRSKSGGISYRIYGDENRLNGGEGVGESAETPASLVGASPRSFSPARSPSPSTNLPTAPHQVDVGNGKINNLADGAIAQALHADGTTKIFPEASSAAYVYFMDEPSATESPWPNSPFPA